MAGRYVVGAALGLVLLMAWTASPTAAEGAATTASPPTFTGQVLLTSLCCTRSDDGTVIVGETTFPHELCDAESTVDQPLDISFSASGSATDTAVYYPAPRAAGPYGGTYALTATMTLAAGLRAEHPRHYTREITGFSGSFHIRSAAGRVDGALQLAPNSAPILDCWLRSSGHMTAPLAYTATIAPSGGGLFRDAGVSVFDRYYHEDPLIESLSTTFTSEFSAPQPLLTQRGECMKDGWRSYGRFTNQGDCISLVQNGP
jgi:hypothetical protein